MKYRYLAAWIFLGCITVAVALAGDDKGPEKIVLDGGTRGEVPFPHHQHQNVLLDCNLCHDLFPRERGSIETLKSSGKLAGKEIMNKHCIKCHRAEKRAGNKSGPTSCGACHVRG